MALTVTSPRRAGTRGLTLKASGTWKVIVNGKAQIGTGPFTFEFRGAVSGLKWVIDPDPMPIPNPRPPKWCVIAGAGAWKVVTGAGTVSPTGNGPFTFKFDPNPKTKVGISLV